MFGRRGTVLRHESNLGKRKRMSKLAMTRRGVIALAAAAGAPLGAVAQGTGYPSRLVRIIVPFPPGGAGEALARIYGERLSRRWSRPVILENRVGAGTTLAAAYVANQAPDGHTLYNAPAASHVISAATYQNLAYDPIRSFTTVASLAVQPYIFATHPSSPVTSLARLIEMARARPGTLSYASTGIGAAPHLSMELLKSMAGIDVLHVPFNGSSPASAAAMGRHVDIVAADASLAPLIRDGALRALAVTTAQRWPGFPDVPAVAEAGFAGYDMYGGGWLFGPAGIPAEIEAQINADVVSLQSDPDVVRALELVGHRPPPPTTPAQLRAAVTAELQKYAEIVRQVGLPRN
jgi:tripartite-type tricarboxylate transporter receptor subunit TctC